MAEQQPWAKREDELLQYWKEQEIFRISVEREAPHGDFVFYEGPPTANAPPGIHHVESRTFKDVIPRYKTMRGYRVQRKAGWDTHGLPVELQIEKKLGLKTKHDVEAYGIAAFNVQCRDSVWAFKQDWEKLTERIGFWIDQEDPYITYEMPYVESVWWFLKQCHERGLLERSHKSVWYCPRCETPLSSHEVAQGYKDDTEDPSVYVKFKVTGIPEKNVYFLAWTTTPWTLPGNVALAVHPELPYALVRPLRHSEQSEESHTKQSSDELYVVAEAAVERIFGAGAEVIAVKPGSELVGYTYEPLYTSERAIIEKMYSVLPAAFVSLDDGTGIVHIAPAFGADDFELGKANGIAPLITVSPSGVMYDEYPGAGKFFKDADTDVRADLRARGLLFRDERITHTYPFCWRCQTPLLTYARASWYIMMSKLRPEIQKLNGEIGWHPEHIQSGRMGEWLREVKDWAITRERYWGAPLPIWKCDACNQTEVLGSFAELLERAPKRNRFLLMRHGEAVSNVTQRISTKLETSDQYPLTEKGEQLVREAAEQLRREGITKIVASPYHRIQQTATIVSGIVGVPVETAHELREFDLPDFDGQPTGTYNEQFSRRIERWAKKIGTNETWDELRTRMLTFLKKLDSCHEGETILVVTHGDNLWLIEWVLSGYTRSAIDLVPYPKYDNPHSIPFVGALVNERGEFDVHRPNIDAIAWPCGVERCTGTMRRYPEVADVWLESGAMPFAQHHYPFEWHGREEALPYPAGYISEAIDQTRGWFYTLLAVATALGMSGPPYRNCVVLGHLLDKKGKKMSKSKGNIVNPWEMIERYGADTVRWYMLTTNQPWDPKLFDEADLKVIGNKPFGTLRNVLSFWELHGGGASSQWCHPERSEGSRTNGARDALGDALSMTQESGHVLDQWLRARFASLHHDVTEHLDAYHITEAARAVGEAIDELSTWWLRRSRERLKSGDIDARQTFTAALESLAVLLAPFAPFHAEHTWQALRSHFSPSHGEGEPEGVGSSVHLVSWDAYAPPKSKTDDELRTRMGTTRQLVKLGLEARDGAGVPVRQPLAKLEVSPKYREAYHDIAAEELNVKEIVVVQDLKDDVRLDTALTPELAREGMVRELIRKVNGLRKEMGLTPSDRIRVSYHTDDAELARAIHDHREDVIRSTIASQWCHPEEANADEGFHTRSDKSSHPNITIAQASLTLDISKES